MRYDQEEITSMQREAIKIIKYIGRAVGFKYKEIAEIVELIERNSEDYVTEYEERNAACYPIRVVFSAIIEHRKSRVIWYKPWIENRLLNIQKRYCNWWEQFNPDIGIAKKYVPDSFSA